MNRNLRKKLVGAVSALFLAVFMLPMAASATSAEASPSPSPTATPKPKVQISIGSEYSKVYDGKEISKSDIAKSKLWVPGLAEQRAIACRLAAADMELDLIEKELVAWQKKKKALMQLLLTGLVRVNV